MLPRLTTNDWITLLHFLRTVFGPADPRGISLAQKLFWIGNFLTYAPPMGAMGLGGRKIVLKKFQRR